MPESQGLYGPLVDTHAHLADAAFDGDREGVLARASAAGVVSILVMGEGEADNDRVMHVCAEYGAPLIPCQGLFPDQAGPAALEALAARVRARASMLGAIGEVGLDFLLAREEGERRVQEQTLRGLVALSNETGLPLSVHSRSCGRRCIELLLEAGAERVVLHAFDAKAGYALVGVEAGWYFSIPPSIVRSRQKERLAALLPLDSILLESDAPVLGPVPGRRNEPAFVTVALERIAEIRGVEPVRVAEATCASALRLFGSKLGL